MFDQTDRSTVIERTSGVTLDFARPEDDAGIRALLRDQPLGGSIRVSLEREPGASLAAGVEGERHDTLVARQDGRIVGMGSRSVRPVWLNGEPSMLGYLGSLRRDPSVMSHRRLLGEGYRRLEETWRDDELPFDLTSIVADNTAARRVLERGLPRLPIYRPLGEFVTLVIAVPRRSAAAPAVAADYAGIADCLRRNLRRYQFAPRWTAESLASPVRSRGLAVADFVVLTEGSRVRACAAVWDQRGFKQTVVRGYSAGLARSRGWLNAALRLAGRPMLPPPGTALRTAFLSHVAADDETLLESVLGAALAKARDRDLDYLIAGAVEGSPMLAALRRGAKRQAREYRSVLYLVHPPGTPDPREQLDGRPIHAEVATL